MQLTKDVLANTVGVNGSSQAAVGRNLRSQGYNFANKAFRAMWDEHHGKSLTKVEAHAATQVWPEDTH